MTKVTIDRALVEQAVEALTKSVWFCNHMGVGDWQPTAMACHSGIAALRAALAEPAAEPVKGLFVDLIAQYPGLAEELAAIVIDAPPAEPVVEPTCKQPLQVHKQTGWVAHKNQYAVPVLFNPYTGEPRDVRDVQSDPQGVLIVPPGKVEMIAASPPPPAEPARTSQDVCTVPLLRDEEILQLTPLWLKKYTDGVLLGHARAIEQLVHIKFRTEFMK